MKRVLPIILILIIAAGVSTVYSQSGNTSVFKASDSWKAPNGFIKSLLDPNRFTMTHSYNLSFGRIGNYSMNHGLYTNTMTYQIAKPLTAQVAVGLLHQPFPGNNELQQIGTKLFIQHARMQFKPSDKFSVTVDYQAYPAGTYNPYRRGYGYNSRFGFGSMGETDW